MEMSVTLLSVQYAAEILIVLRRRVIGSVDDDKQTKVARRCHCHDQNENIF
jgi:hypothetical protein